jgi:hypothetical protein
MTLKRLRAQKGDNRHLSQKKDNRHFLRKKGTTAFF